MKPVPQFHPNAKTISGYDDIDNLDAVLVEYPSGRKGIISCWRPSWRELLHIVFRRRIYLAVLARQQPPVSLMADPAEVW